MCSFCRRPISWVRILGSCMTLLLLCSTCLFLAADVSHAEGRYLYVDGVSGTDRSIDGTECNDCLNRDWPCATITNGIEQAESGDTLWIATGVYTENLMIDKPVALFGGFETDHWSRSLQMNTTTILGDGAPLRTVFVTTTLSISTVIDGFDITGGDGGLLIDDSAVIIQSCRIVANHATSETGGSGGGLFADHSFVTIRDTLIADNTATSHDGGLRVTSSLHQQDLPRSAVMIDGCTIANNRDLSDGGPDDPPRHGIFNSLSLMAIHNSIIWGHEGTDIWPGSFPMPFPVTYSDIEMPYPDTEPGTSWPGVGNICADPLFRDSAGGDYHLTNDSPCLDASDPATNLTRDYEGDERPTDGDTDGSARADMGSDERRSYRYVSAPTGADESNDCAYPGHPCASIAHALTQAEKHDTILIAEGLYTDGLVLDQAVSLVGGHEPESWSRSLRSNRTTTKSSPPTARAIEVRASLSETTVIDGLTIADSDGGVLAVGSSLVVRNCKVVGNHATSNTIPSGGGMFIDHSRVGITNTLIASNQADSRDGAIRIISTIASNLPMSEVLLDNCTIANNRDLSDCGPADPPKHGVFISLSDLRIHNSVLWGHEGSDIIDTSTPPSSVTYSCIGTSPPNGEPGAIWPGEGNIRNDPQFRDPADDDYHLMPGSPCLDTGDPDTLLSHDIEGDWRPSDGGLDGSSFADMGADELCHLWLPLILYNSPHPRP